MTSGKTALSRWWSQKYNRPPNDPSYRDQSTGLLLREFFEDIYRRKEELEAQIQDASGQEVTSINKALDAVRKILAVDDDEITGETGDPVVDEWIRDLEEGRTPNLQNDQWDKILKKIGMT